MAKFVGELVGSASVLSDEGSDKDELTETIAIAISIAALFHASRVTNLSHRFLNNLLYLHLYWLRTHLNPC